MLARSPRVAGKTRLTRELEPDDALRLRTALLLDAVEAVLALDVPLVMLLDPMDDAKWLRGRLAEDDRIAPALVRCDVVAQGPGDLGARMTHAMTTTLARGFDAVILVGSDAPDLPVEHLRDVAQRLATVPVDNLTPPLVLGPADDGGFYLVAARHAEADAFNDVRWSQNTVLAAVTSRARAAGRDVILASPWRDVDTPDDLQALLARRGDGALRTREVARTLSPYNRAR
jgi:uncharacterized protein